MAFQLAEMETIVDVAQEREGSDSACGEQAFIVAAVVVGFLGSSNVGNFLGV